MARNTKLNDLHRAFIVRELACYASPTQAVEALNQCFGVVISPQATERYRAFDLRSRTSLPRIAHPASDR